MTKTTADNPRGTTAHRRAPRFSYPSPFSGRPASDRGMVALITVIIIGAMVLLIGVSGAFIGQTDVILAGDADRGGLALGLASACAEEALYRVKLDTGYSGGTIPLGADTCTAAVAGIGSTRTITATAVSGDHTKVVEMSVTLRQNAGGQAKAWRIDSWTEVDP